MKSPSILFLYLVIKSDRSCARGKIHNQISSHSPRFSPAQYSLTVQNRGLKHHSLLLLIHLISPGCLQLSIALQCSIVAWNTNHFIVIVTYNEKVTWVLSPGKTIDSFVMIFPGKWKVSRSPGHRWLVCMDGTCPSDLSFFLSLALCLLSLSLSLSLSLCLFSFSLLSLSLSYSPHKYVVSCGTIM